MSELVVLIVDGDERHGLLIADMVSAMGVTRFRRVSSGKAALDTINALLPDVILCALRLSDGDGLDFTRKVRRLPSQLYPAVPILMMCATVDRDTVLAARDSGITDLMMRPLSQDDLVRRLYKVLSDKRAFIESEDFAGPDRRKPQPAVYKGTDRRKKKRPA